MENLRFDLSRNDGRFKPLNAVNNGPTHKGTVQCRSNFNAYKAARIPYARNHDAAFWSGYGGEHSVDITAVFPDFDADPYAEASYDFACTDEYIRVTLEAGTETFYRLGQKIEHYIKKFGTIPPKDFQKWAVICEHIIRHYNEGWANGQHLNITYWEIWNEPDLHANDDSPKDTWGGTQAAFFDMYEITAKYLKARFPQYKIGGPALAHDAQWAEAFLSEMQRRQVPIDFFSWHIYNHYPQEILKKSELIHALLTKYGYTDAESILNEWNYVKGWTDEFVYSIKTIIGIKGAAYTMACMSLAQPSTIDMLMYYDARPCAFNGLFDFYTYAPLKGYYPFLWYGMLYDLDHAVNAKETPEDIYSLCGVGKDGKVTAIVTYFSDNDAAEEKQLQVDFGKEGTYEVFLLDATHDATSVGVRSELTFQMKANTCIMIKEL